MESIGMLASGVAHEFNNILTGIIPNAELIKITTGTKHPNYSRADSIQKSASRASEIVKKLLNFARTESISKEESTKFDSILKDTIEILKRLFDKRIKIKCIIQDNLLNAKLDETSIQQIIMNLSINAKDAISDEGEIRFEVSNYNSENENSDSLLTLKPGKYINFKVIDTGHGIENIHLKHIFDPFYTTKAPGKGTGLGLSMVYGIINSCNGSIEVKSDVNNGTEFNLFIPAIEEKKKNDISEFTNERIGVGNTILVVDDEDIIAEMASDMLESLGFKVLIASNGLDAIKIYRNNIENIDVVLLDLIMPEMDGTSCLNNLTMLNPDVKVVISSGLGNESNKAELFKMGAIGYLEKPYSIKKISHVLETIIND
jgi:CheY-like chemotaxis protein